MRKILTLLFITTSFTVFAQNTTHQYTRNKGYFNITKVGFLNSTEVERNYFVPGEGTFFSSYEASDAYGWSIQNISGFFISRHFSLGAGIGFDNHYGPTFRNIPVFADVRLFLNDKSDTFFCFLDIGPSLKLGDDTSTMKKGMMTNVGIGYKYEIGEGTHIMVDLFYAYKKATLSEDTKTLVDNNVEAKGTGVSVGLIF